MSAVIVMTGINMKLDKSKPYSEIMGAINGAKYAQNYKEYDASGNLIKAENDTIQPEQTTEIKPKKLGRPYKT